MLIKTPRDNTIYSSDGIDGKLVWNPSFGAVWQGRYSEAQKFVDSEVIRLSVPYTPFDSSFLQKSALLGTDIGSGTVEWIAPYAKYMYYGKLMVSPSTGSSWAERGERKVLTPKKLNYNGAPKRGAFWFERMKADHKAEILQGAGRFMRG